MKKVDQTIVDKDKGDCLRAVAASMFELDITQVPDFNVFGDEWYDKYRSFIESQGHDMMGCRHVIHGSPFDYGELLKTPMVNGCISAGVKSRTFEDRLHAVLIDQEGVVVHDPNPNKLFLGVNVIDTGELNEWDIIMKKEEK